MHRAALASSSDGAMEYDVFGRPRVGQTDVVPLIMYRPVMPFARAMATYPHGLCTESDTHTADLTVLLCTCSGAIWPLKIIGRRKTLCSGVHDI